MTRPEFDASLAQAAPPASFPPVLAALWWISNSNWERAHLIIDAEQGADCAWVHAYLHRIEGDEGNANYWYQRSGRDKPDYGLSKERDVLLKAFL